MSTIDAKPVSKKILNAKLLSIAAIVLMLLALVFMATPLLRSAGGLQRNGNVTSQGNGQVATQNGTAGQGTPQFFINPGTGSQGGSNIPNQQGAVRSNLFGGVTGAYVFFIALLVSLVAALGMFYTRRWGQVLGIIMSVLYLLVGLVSLLPILLTRIAGSRNPLSLILGIVHVLLAITVIVLASIPAKKMAPSAAIEMPPAVSM